VPTGPEDRDRLDESVAERLATLASWVGEIDSRVHAAEVATGDEKTAKELRKALEALAKHDPKLEKRLTDRVDVLADRLSTLGSTVSTTAAALAGKEGEIAGLRRELDKSGEQIEALMQQLKRTAGAADVERLQRTIAAAAPEKGSRRDDKRVDELRGKVDYLTERLDTLAKTVGATAAGVSGREGDLALLRERLDESSKHVQLTLVELQRRLEDTDLVERVDSLATAVAQTSSGLATRESETAAVRARLDDSYARVGTVVTEIRESIEALGAQVAALEKFPGAAEQALESRAAELDARLSTLGERVESVAAGVTAALTGVSDREAELAALAARVDEASSRVDAVGAELRSALAELPEPGTVDPEVESRLETLRGTVSAVTSQLEALDSASNDRAKEAAARAAELEQMLAEVAERLDAVERERDAAAMELTRAAESWAAEREWVRGRLEEISAAHADTSEAQDALAPQLSALTERLASMESEREALGADIARVSQALDEERASLHAELEALGARLAEAASASAGDESERLLAELGERLDAVERDGVAASELARAAAAWGEEREWVHQRLEEISAAHADTSPAQDVLAPLAELGSRLDAVERDGAAVASEVARAASYWASELDSLETRLDRVLATPQGEAASPVAGATDELLTQLAERVEAMERGRDALATEIGRVSTAWASDRSSLEGRLEQVATHLDEVEAAAAGATAPAASSGNEVEQLRVQVEGLRMRLAASEKELTAFTGSREVAGRLDELARRIDGVERVAMTPSVVVSSAGAPVAGDGRFRLELRALELRMEHAEAASREHREAVLVQLERLASRIEWRLQRLEAEHEETAAAAVGGGAQVVPIRSGGDV
jgi:DNA repair exonuclease SbcCD ATPase subunit